MAGSLRATDTLYSTTAQFQILRVPTTSGGTTFGPGSANNLLKSNGTSVYWTTLVANDIPNLNTSKLTEGTLPISRGGTGTTVAPTQYGLIYASTTSAYASTGAGTSGQYLKSNGSSAPSWANFPTIPTITLNGSSTTSPSFYAPTSAGTSGYYLKSNGSGAPTWESIPTINATASGSGNIVTAISATNHTITYTLDTLVSAQIIRW